MFAMLSHVLITMIGAIAASGTLAFFAWTVLRRTRYPGLGPIVGFAILAVLRNAGEFTQMLLMFSAIFAAGAFASLFDADGKTRQLTESTGFRHLS